MLWPQVVELSATLTCIYRIKISFRNRGHMLNNSLVCWFSARSYASMYTILKVERLEGIQNRYLTRLKRRNRRKLWRGQLGIVEICDRPGGRTFSFPSLQGNYRQKNNTKSGTSIDIFCRWRHTFFHWNCIFRSPSSSRKKDCTKMREFFGAFSPFHEKLAPLGL